MWLVDALLAVVALGLALSLRPWRAVAPEGPPLAALLWWAVLPLLWMVDRAGGSPLAQPLAGSCLLMLMVGWPLAVLGMAVAGLMLWGGGIAGDVVLQRVVWLGLVPASLGVLIGAGTRRWLPHHLMVYILGRGFFGTAVAGTLAGIGAALLHGHPPSLALHDLLLARGLAAWGDAFLTGMFAAIFVAYRPQWLATYSDRLYLPR